ncbi:hypothetical protein A3224_15010 [Microbulbifer thermotolerans]|uniref:RHS repeat-associated core domain-containing protein n=1 Tax=Microbulbifer thermotolerans TaxID=252514 RepID=A0A143HPS3_MICTH|nr:hypothetical protein A3224_15010 [Microbulbifer thermotolerans]
MYQGAKPHAVTKVGTVSYEYDDNNGNLTSDSTGREFFYTSFDKPSLIKSTGSYDQTAFFYGPDRSRYKRIDTRANGEVITTLYLGNVERIHRSSDGKYRWKRYLPGGGVFTYTTDADFNQQSFTEQYLLKDHIGSTDVVLDANGNILETMAFDPWGKRRDADWQAIDISDFVADNYSLLESLTDTTTKGFTGHEMVDALGVIHMNGRIYDPELGRFLQADSFIDGVDDTQGYNRYSYVKGNPLTLTDPTGYYSWGDLVDDVKGFLKDLCGDSCGVNVDSNGNIDLYAGQLNPDHGGFWAQPGAAGISTPEGTVPGAFGESKREGESIWDLITSQGTSENGGGFEPDVTLDSVAHLLVDGNKYSSLFQEVFHGEQFTDDPTQLAFEGVFVRSRSFDRAIAMGEISVEQAADLQNECRHQGGGCVAIAVAGEALGVLPIVGLSGRSLFRSLGVFRSGVTKGGLREADNIANGPKLAKQLRLESANSPFTKSGHLTDDAVRNSREIIPASEINNPAIPKGFSKYSTETFQSPSGNFQTHFYKNPKTGEVFYGQDYKVIFNSKSGG